jgi:hypothetical protein
MEGSVIGVSLGTRLAGIAIMKRNELMLYKVRAFKEPWSKQKQNEILRLFDKLYDQYGVQYLTIKLVPSLHSSKALDELTKSLMARAKKLGIMVSSYSLHDIRKSLSLGKKQNLNEYVAFKYVELRREYEKEQNSLNPYHSKMFEAIACCELEINSKL